LLKPGDSAPDFSLPDHTGALVTLSAELRAGPVALVFYPRDFSPICTREVCMVRDIHTDLARAGVRVFGVSADSVASHARFRARHGIDFALLADVDHAVIRAYDVSGFLGLLPGRITYLIGRDGRIVDAVSAELRVGQHAALLERALLAARA